MINTCVEVAEAYTKFGTVKPPVADSRRISISVIVRSSRYSRPFDLTQSLIYILMYSRKKKLGYIQLC